MSEVVRLVSREELGAVERWDMPAVKPPPSARSAPGPTVAELEAIGEQARREGLEQGLAEGRRQAQAELGAKIAELEALFQALARPLEDIDIALERQLAELATLIARRVLEAELRLQPEHLVEVVRRAIGALPAATGSIDIAVHPHSAALLREGLADAAENAWRIVEDASLKRGDISVRSADSRIDGSVESRLGALVEAALNEDGALAHHGAAR